MLIPVCSALSGRPLSLDLPGGSLVEELYSTIKRQLEIEVENQIVMCEWEPESGMNQRKTLSSYGLPRQDNQVIFFYDKSWFKSGLAGTKTEDEIIVIKAQLPNQEKSLSNSAFMSNQDSGEPMQSAIFNFYARFAHWKATADAFLVAAKAREKACQDIRNEVKMQHRGSALARKSLMCYFSAVRKSIEKLETELESARLSTEENLKRSEVDACLEKLQMTSLHKAHCAVWRVPEGTKLISFVKDTDLLNKCVESCHSLVSVLESKVGECIVAFQELEDLVNLEMTNGDMSERSTIAEVESFLESMSSERIEIENFNSAISEDVRELEATLPDLSNGERDVGNLLDLMNKLQSKYSQFKDGFNELSTHDNSHQKLMEGCSLAKKQMTEGILDKLQRVATLQGRLLDTKKKSDALLAGAVNERKRRINQVEIVLRLPETYKAWCEEVHKRNAYYDNLVANAEHISGAVQDLVDNEEERRLEFLEKYEAYLPAPLLDLLNEGASGAAGHPPRMEIHVSRRPKQLPEIRLRDLEEGAAGNFQLLQITRERGDASGAKAEGEQEEAPRSEEPDKRVNQDMEAVKSQMEELENELSEKERLWRKANEGKAELQLKLNETIERVNMERAQREKLQNALIRIGSLLQIDLQRQTPQSSRLRKSEDRDIMDPKSLENVISSIGDLVEKSKSQRESETFKNFSELQMNAQKSEAQISKLEEELEKKNKLFSGAMQNAASLEIQNKKVGEELQLEKSNREKLLSFASKLSASLGMEVIKPLPSSSRALRGSEDRDLEVKLDNMLQRISELMGKPEERKENPGQSIKISLSSFEPGDVALFMPCGKDRTDAYGNSLYVAFNVDCPRHFLHTSSLEEFFNKDKARAESYCLGRITVCYEATEDDFNEFGMTDEETFHVCYAEPVLTE
uniref:Autophagy-related protein 11 C-terminal domain-containing protein n=2 Tax=Guillardia theta TaxID=55529 RepID=A0A7S4PKR0_GUITH|mmetsp:Transcript_52564/g.163125  ORF Transcript_52564/g.163125 Transcript_52564/m.163125 type:complete len:915 (+) Transcript_52564:144-2888(+)